MLEAAKAEGLSSVEGLQENMPIKAKKIQKMRYKYEEDLEEAEGREGQKYKGYVDDTYAADSTNGGGAGGNASYAIMIYDVRKQIIGA